MEDGDRRIQTGHVGLNVSDLERSKAFYREVLGFEVLGESSDGGRRYALLGEEGALVLTLWQQSEGRFPTERPGLHHLSFRVATIEAVVEAERRLRELGAAFHYDGVVPHAEGSSSGGVFFEDPDGIRLEIFSATGAAGHAAPVAGAPTCGFF